MKVAFCTKRDINGNVKILIIDNDKRQYARDSSSWFCRSDFVTCSVSDLRKMEERAEKAGFARVDYLAPGV